jgi:hypothetical protein
MKIFALEAFIVGMLVGFSLGWRAALFGVKNLIGRGELKKTEKW